MLLFFTFINRGRNLFLPSGFEQGPQGLRLVGNAQFVGISLAAGKALFCVSSRQKA